jgi:hypothetical protein
MKKNISILLAIVASAVATSSLSQADIAVGPGVLNFGSETVGSGASPMQYIIIQNQDPKNAVTGLELEAPFCDGFEFNTTCQSTLAPSEACQIFVDFRPLTAMVYQCIVRVGATSQPGEADVTLLGQGNQF